MNQSPKNHDGLFSAYVVELSSLKAELADLGVTRFKNQHPHPFLLVMYSSTALRSKPAEQIIPLKQTRDGPASDKITLGRARENDIGIQADRMSKLHCVFEIKPDGKVSLTDMASANGTRLNGTFIQPNEPVPLQSGDVISIVKHVFKFVDLEELIRICETEVPS